MKQGQSLSITTKLLHIIVAVAFIGLITVGIYMVNTETYALYPVHKSVGAIVLIIALVRVWWRIRKGWPTELEGITQGQALLARFIHWVLIVSTLLFPITGLMMSIGGGRGLSVFSLDLIAANIDEVTGKAIALNGTIAELGGFIHTMIPPLVILAIVLHIAGALKHHFVDKDVTLKRMF